MNSPAPTPAYRAWVLGLLVTVYTSNFIDRTIVAVLQQPIKNELRLSDAQLGFLGGFAFAIFYAGLGLPIARLAERANRKAIVAVSLAVWSVMTALCGFASGFATLFLFRVGVGIGEAGGSPPSQSMISDYYPPEKRATALSIYSLGIPFGSLLGAILGGIIAQRYGWRSAFFVVGGPGLVLALVMALTMKEPARGRYDTETSGATLPLMGVVRHLAARRSWIHIAIGASLAAFASYGIGGFSAAYFIRAFHLSVQDVGLLFGLLGGVSAAGGTLAGGLVTDRLGRRDARWYALVPAIGLIVSAPITMAGYLAPTLWVAVVILLVPPILQYTFLGPSLGLTHNMVGPRMRATATAILFLVINLIGLGFGPLFVGWLSDFYARRSFLGDFAASCPGGRPAQGAASDLVMRCGEASAVGLRWAIVTAALVFVWAGVHYALAARHVRDDLNRL